MTAPLPYAIVTPAHDEAENLPRLARCLAEQIHRPVAWIIVDNASTDATAAVIAELAARHEWVRPAVAPGDGPSMRGGPIARAFHLGLAALGDLPPVVVKLDADVSMEPHYFAQLARAFAADDRLGIASGSCYEEDGGTWRRRHLTGAAVWGAARAYRRECLDDVLPLEERMGWDGIDEVKAELRGWRTRTILDLAFRHHRAEGARDGRRWRAWSAGGRGAHYMGYRFWYLVVRAAFQALKDPSAVALVWGYAAAAARGEPRCPDAAVRRYVRSRQTLRALPRRLGEALGRRPPVEAARS